MSRLFIVFIMMILALPAAAQGVPGDIVSNISSVTAPWKAMTAAEGVPAVGVGIAQCGSAPASADGLVASVSLVGPYLGEVVSGSVTFAPSTVGGCFEAYSYTSDGTLSAKSPNRLLINWIPLPPVFIQ